MGRLVRIPREASRTLDPARGTAGESAPARLQQDDYLLRLVPPVEGLTSSLPRLSTGT